MSGKLLHFVSSFCWNNKLLDRSLILQDFNAVFIKARSEEDNIYCPETMFQPLNKDIIFQFLYIDGYKSYEEIKLVFPWLTDMDFQLLHQLTYQLGNPTPNSSVDYTSFANEFQQSNCSLIGLRDTNCSEPLVYNIKSHDDFHAKPVFTYNFAQQKANFKNFKKYYVPTLKIDAGKIKKMIDTNKVNNDIVRLDPPKTDPKGKPIHGQQIHIHIMVGDHECALNLDGTWKHPPNENGNHNISAEVCSVLSDWGFVLPDKYYQ